MASHSDGRLQIYNLGEDATNAARTCGEKLREANTFQKVSIGADPSGEYEIWDGGDLMDLCRPFIGTFPPLLSRVKRSESILFE